MYVTLDHVATIGPLIQTFWFRPEKPFEYTAGQFTEIYLPHENPDDRGERRWFTICSSPTESLLSITTRFTPESVRSSTFKQTLRTLPIGARLQWADPMGDFVLPKDKAVPIVFVAGGMGVTPMRSMVKYALDQHEQRTIHLLHSVRHVEDLIFSDLFKTFPLHYLPQVQEATPAWKGDIGTLDIGRVLDTTEGTQNALIYLSGPEPMLQALSDGLLASGIPKHRIVTDFFPGYREI